MARPKPTVLVEFINPKNFKVEQVLDAHAIYAVYYKGKPINLRVGNSLVAYPGPKYKKTAFSAPAHAFNLAERLNKMFNTKDFTVFMLTGGVQITEDQIDIVDSDFDDSED